MDHQKPDNQMTPVKCSQDAPIAVLAVQLNHLIQQQKAVHEMLQAHLKAGCIDTACKLNDRVVKLEGTAHSGRKIVWTFLSLWIGSVAAFIGVRIGG